MTPETRITAGVELGPYRIEGPLGAGGMGQVYRATDTRLNRPVAIKVVSEEFSHRFQREARAISALNHPHICTLYDVGPTYLVMELVEGETLAGRLKRGRLPVDAVVRYGGEIAGALAAAHAKGIIHRDLKPANLMVTKSGLKVLDFGLAKSIQADETRTAGNLIQGTPAYMAPEQLEGKACDARTDIYGLGLVLYEMATGQRLKQGEAATLDGLPARLAHVIDRCLAQEPDDRWQSARDVKAELEWAGTGRAEPVKKPTSRWVWAAAAILGVGLLAAAAAVWIRGATPAAPQPARFILSFDEQLRDPFYLPKPSPDGRYFAFVGGVGVEPNALWLRPLDAVQARPLPGTGGAWNPFWSPDGRWIGFVADGKLKKISPAGSTPQTIAPLPGVHAEAFHAAWGTRGDIIYQTTNRGPLFRIHESGGTPEQITTLDRSRTENSHRRPFFLPDGRRFLFTSRCGDPGNNALYLATLDPSSVQRLMPVQSNAAYVPRAGGSPGLLIYYRDSGLVAHRFDGASGRLAGEPVPLDERVNYDFAGVRAFFEVSAAGNVLVVRPPGASERQLTWFNRNGVEVGITGPRGYYFQPRLSPRGDRIAYSGIDPQTGNRELWSIEIARGVAARLTTHPANDWFPIWSPDGTQLVFGSDRDGGAGNYPYLKKSMDPGSDESRLLDPRTDADLGLGGSPYDWSQDGKWISIGGLDIWVAPVFGDRKPFPFLATPFLEGGGRFSADGKWIAYTSDESGRSEVYVRPFAGQPATAEGKIQISNRGGDYPVWRADGQELFFIAADSHLYSVSTKDLSRPGAAPIPERLFRPCRDTGLAAPPMRNASWGYQYDTRDGQRFLFTCRAEPAGRFVVLMNWLAAGLSR